MVTNTPPLRDVVDAATLDELFGALSSKARRQLVAYLYTRRGPVPFDELVADLSATVDDRDVAADPTRLAIRLYHVDLPKLETVGMVEVSDGPTGRSVHSTDLLRRVVPSVPFLRPDER